MAIIASNSNFSKGLKLENRDLFSVFCYNKINKFIFKFIKIMISKGLKRLLESNAIGFATIGKNGKPHNIAVAYVKVIDNKIIISNSHIKESIKNLRFNNNVSLVVWNKEWKNACVGFELQGKAKNYTTGKWFDFVSKLPDNEGCKIVSAIVVKTTKIKRLLS